MKVDENNVVTLTMTPKGVYHLLRIYFIHDYEGHFTDDYDGQNKLERKATIYAVKNTAEKWRSQYD